MGLSQCPQPLTATGGPSQLGSQPLRLLSKPKKGFVIREQFQLSIKDYQPRNTTSTVIETRLQYFNARHKL